MLEKKFIDWTQKLVVVLSFYVLSICSIVSSDVNQYHHILNLELALSYNKGKGNDPLNRGSYEVSMLRL